MVPVTAAGAILYVPSRDHKIYEISGRARHAPRTRLLDGRPGNQPPVADAGPDQSATVGPARHLHTVGIAMIPTAIPSSPGPSATAAWAMPGDGSGLPEPDPHVPEPQPAGLHRDADRERRPAKNDRDTVKITVTGRGRGRPRTFMTTSTGRFRSARVQPDGPQWAGGRRGTGDQAADSSRTG